MPQDSTIDFEKRRNIPVRYDRELVQTTIKAMKKVTEIKAKRDRVFFKHRYAPLPRFLKFLLTPCQHGCCTREAESSSQEGSRARKIVASQAATTHTDRDQGKNQGPCTGKERTGPRGGSVNGHGCGLRQRYVMLQDVKVQYRFMMQRRSTNGPVTLTCISPRSRAEHWGQEYCEGLARSC